MADRIVVVVSGGVVQDVLGVPPGIVVELHDYDTDGTDESLGIDEEGYPYFFGEWRHEPGAGVRHPA
jgi:hypothetical protein